MIADNNNGRSMVEMLGVLAIVGILTVGGFSLVSKVSTSNQTNSVMDEISGLASKVRIVVRDLDKVDVQSVCKAKAYPDTLECGEEGNDDSSCNCSTFLGSADIEYSVTGVEEDEYPALFELTASNLSDEMCMSLLTANWGSESSSGFMGVKGKGSAKEDAIANATSSCNGDDNSLTFVFR